MNADKEFEQSGADLKGALKDLYGIRSPFKLTRIYDGRALNYRVSEAAGDWLLKVFQSDYDLNRVNLASDFVDYLSAAGCPVEPFHRTVAGPLVAVFGERPTILVRWLPGETRSPNTMDQHDGLRQLGRLSGLIHRVAKHYPRSADLAATVQTDDFSLAKRRARFERNTLAAGAADPEVKGEIERRLQIADEIGQELEASEREAVRQTIHGDFYCAHSVWQRGTAIGVIDALGGHHIPGWEMMRCFFLSIRYDSRTEVEAIESLWEPFADGYSSENPLTKREIEVAYDIYLLSLTLSSYGLSLRAEAPWQGEEALAKLRDFGRWRSETAEYLASKRQSLRSLMANQAAGS